MMESLALFICLRTTGFRSSFALRAPYLAVGGLVALSCSQGSQILQGSVAQKGGEAWQQLNGLLHEVSASVHPPEVVEPLFEDALEQAVELFTCKTHQGPAEWQ